MKTLVPAHMIPGFQTVTTAEIQAEVDKLGKLGNRVTLLDVSIGDTVTLLKKP